MYKDGLESIVVRICFERSSINDFKGTTLQYYKNITNMFVKYCCPVGATKKQIKKNVIFEGLLLGVVGIPLGVISGFFAVFVLLQIVNNLLGEQLHM